ncbi:hypothetical protein Tco_0719406 [Tanacetum coccineum]
MCDRSKRLIGLNKSVYIEKILKRFYMENSKRGTIPMQEKLKLSKSQGASTPAEKQRMQNIPYASAIGSIMLRFYIPTKLREGSYKQDHGNKRTKSGAATAEHTTKPETKQDATRNKIKRNGKMSSSLIVAIKCALWELEEQGGNSSLLTRPKGLGYLWRI